MMYEQETLLEEQKLSDSDLICFLIVHKSANGKKITTLENSLIKN